MSRKEKNEGSEGRLGMEEVNGERGGGGEAEVGVKGGGDERGEGRKP